MGDARRRVVKRPRMAELIVTSRFPTYEFVIRTGRSVKENEEILRSFLAFQPRPRGFVLADPRVIGSFEGSVFRVRSREALFQGSSPPYAEGYLVPNDLGGSDAVVQVQNSPTSLVFVGAAGVAVAIGAVTSLGWWSIIVVPLVFAMGGSLFGLLNGMAGSEIARALLAALAA
jgi:hypothetical protein